MTADALWPIANDEATGSLEEALRGALAAAPPDEARIAVAYISPAGLLAVEPGLAGAAEVRLLLGERPFMARRGPPEALEQPPAQAEQQGPSEAVDWHGFLDGQYPWLLLTRAQREALAASDPEAAARAGVNPEVWVQVARALRFLRRGQVQVRRYLGPHAGAVAPGQVLTFQSPHARLHAKAYLFRGAGGASLAAVGSSNLTLGGLRGNIELNLLSSDAALGERLAHWFDDRWAQGQDCRQEFIDLLADCVLFGRRYRPWDVFLKALHAAYGRFLNLGLADDVTARLADFQAEAVRRCLTMLERHWGAMLCDSVGLGKTWEGLGVLSEFARRREGRTRALIVCPAQLASTWDHERTREFDVSAEVVTMESLARLVDLDEAAPQERAQAETRLRRLQQADIVLVDESHNFRNPQTKRYRALQEIIRGGAPDTRVLLLTATPINNSVWDLYHQLLLLTRGDDAWYAGRGPVANLRATFADAARGGGGAGLLDTMLLSLVRRTRHDLRALEAAGEPPTLDGAPLRFPAHEIPRAVAYSLQNLYGDIYRDVLQTIQDLSFAVYRLEDYGVEPGERESRARVRQRSDNFVGIMRTILLKRMESSVAALTATVDALVAYLDQFLARLAEGRVLTPAQAHRLRAVLGGSLPDADTDPAAWDPQAVETLRELRAAPVDAAQRARLHADAAADRSQLAGLRRRLHWLAELWGAEGDPKIAAVRRLLDGLPPRDAHGLPTKVVIFTNYRDTALHVFRSLGGGPERFSGGELRVRSNLADRRWMSLLHGGDDRGRRAAVLERFAPLAAHRLREALDDPALRERLAPLRAESIELLIATDVLSEGQNLQDAQYLINYDLHWNPVRMIQRAGRIDRLFSPHDTVYIYNVMPEQGLEDLLQLVGSLTRKLGTIEDAVALDASVLGEQIEARELDAIMKIRAGGSAADEVYLEGERTQGLDAGLDVLNQYLELMRSLAVEDVEDIPDGVYSVVDGPRSGVFVMLRMPEELTGEVFWRFYPLDDLARPETSPLQVLETIQAGPDTPRRALPDDVNPFEFLNEPLAAAVAQIGAAYQAAAAAQAPHSLTARLRSMLQRDDLLAADGGLWERLHAWALAPQPSDALRRPRMRGPARVLRQTPIGAPLDDLLPRLRELAAAVRAEGLDRPLARPDSRRPSVRDLELVAWALVVGPEGLPAPVAATAGG